jgi:hypothetical protein
MTPDLLLAYDPDRIRPGWVALGIVVALGVATFLLWRSMNSQLRRIDVPRKDQDDGAGHPEGDEGQPPVADGPDASRPDETPSGADVDGNHPA